MPFWVVEIAGLEPATYTLRTYRATNCAISPHIFKYNVYFIIEGRDLSTDFDSKNA